MNKIELSRMQPIRDVVYQKIRKAILRGDLLPGERLMEEALARTMGISRTPVREALRKLEVEKMVLHNPHKGVVISEVSIDEGEDLYNIRTLVDSVIARRAAQNATPASIDELLRILERSENAEDQDAASEAIDEFNEKLSQIANCPVIADLSRQIRETLSRMILSTYLKPTRRQDAQREHRQIVAAIAAGDADLAQELTAQHIRNAAKTLADMQAGTKQGSA
ncbi:MAG: GntR family transcriptional regulator [Spirochaetes bacterium]|nr:GntR family transcriptional regulator [Spirochaetota bacterium]